ncbi:MAG: DUF308 domain-containing protein [Lachnospiraceae bacterium]|nr:DUF308 domain-containing protein [Lachnospiraceae bacterium]
MKQKSKGRTPKETAKKIVQLLLGLVLVVLGVLALVYPEMLLLLVSLCIMIYGAGTLITWLGRRKTGTGSGWSLAIALSSIGAGLGLLLGKTIGGIALQIVLIILAVWLMSAGVLEVIGAIMYRKAMTTADLGIQAPGSMQSLILGIAMVVAGLLCLLCPLLIVSLSELLLVIAMFVSGARLVVASFSSDALTKEA